MSTKPAVARVALCSLFSLTLAGCFHAPYNNFKKESPPATRAATGIGIGAIVGTFLGNTLIGAGVGGAVGTVNSIYHVNRPAVIRDLQNEDIEFIEYGDTMTLIVPTDRYFEINSPRLNDLNYEGLNNIVKLLKLYPCSTIYVAAFSDNVGSHKHKMRLTQEQAEMMLTFLWANNIPAQRLHPDGFGDHYAIASNQLIRGSAMNRRIEIQWVNSPQTPPQHAIAPTQGGMK
jgi:outer membrane protein OmpA-like peptidoglycan-associated protein